MPFANRKKKNVLEDLLSFVLSQLKKYHLPGNLKSNKWGIFQSWNFILMVEILSIPLKNISETF